MTPAPGKVAAEPTSVYKNELKERTHVRGLSVGDQPSTPPLARRREDDVPRLGNFVPPEFFRVLWSPHREAYWAVLVRAYQRKFLAAGVALTRPEAIDLAQAVLEEADSLGVDPDRIAWDEGWTLPELEDDVPSGSPLRGPARRLIRVLAYSGWVYFQTYADQRYPVLEFTIFGQRQVSHMLREMRGEQMPLRSFADRLAELVGNQCSRMRAAPGRLVQLRDVMANLNERIHELLGSIKQQSDGVSARTRTVRDILQDLLGEFEKRVGYEYALLKRRESPPRLWSAVSQAVYDLREDEIWLHKEAEWYREQEGLEDPSLARQIVLEDLSWIGTVVEHLRQANTLLDERYSRYVSLARKRVQARLRQSVSMADSIQALLDAAAAGRVSLEPVSMTKVVSIGAVGLTFSRNADANNALEPVPEVADLTQEEARHHRHQMDDTIPFMDVRRWVGGEEDEEIAVSVDDLPLGGVEDYLRHIFAARYAIDGKAPVHFEPARCGPTDLSCPSPATCQVCCRREATFSVPRGEFTFYPVRKNA